MSPNTVILFLEPNESSNLSYDFESYYWFFPQFNVNSSSLRLDSQFFVYNCPHSVITIDEYYAIKGEQYHNNNISIWSREAGFSDRGQFIWLRRKNLTGVELIITANSWDQYYFIDSESGESSGFFPAVLDALKSIMNFDIRYTSPEDGNWGVFEQDKVRLAPLNSGVTDGQKMAGSINRLY